MTKFEQIGINHQHDAVSKHDAHRAFARSCHACCNKGLHLDCDKCAISQVHNLVVAIFDDMEKEHNAHK